MKNKYHTTTIKKNIATTNRMAPKGHKFESKGITPPRSNRPLKMDMAAPKVKHGLICSRDAITSIETSYPGISEKFNITAIDMNKTNIVTNNNLFIL